MICLGCPSVYSIRSLEYDDPIAILQRRLLRPTPRHYWISAIEYLIVSLTIANVLILDWQLGYQTISVWNAGAPYLVYLWSLLAIIPHGLSAFTCYYSKSMRAVRRATHQQRQEENAIGYWRARFIREATICAAKSRRGYIEHKKEEPAWVLALNLVAAFM